MRKPLALLLASSLLLLGACGGTSELEEAPPPTTKATTEAKPDAETQEPEPATAQEIVIVESNFGQTERDAGIWWYAAVLENPNTDYVFSFAEVTVEAYDAAGTILDSGSDYLNILPGKFALSGSFYEVGQNVIDHIEIRGPIASEADPAPAGGTGTLATSDIESTSDSYSTTVAGIVSGTFAAEQELVEVTVIAKNPDGTIIGSEFTFVDRLPVDGRVRFEVTFFDVLPEGTLYEVYAGL